MAHHSRRRLAHIVCLFGLSALACLFPADHGTEMYVEITQSPPPLFPGDSFQIRAQVLEADSTILNEVRIAFESNNVNIAAVNQANGFVYARQAGEVTVTAYAPDWPSAAPATQAVRVRRGVSGGVTSIWPDTVHWGETVTMVGRDLAPGEFAALLIGGMTFDSATVVSAYGPSPGGTRDTLVLWVPPPAPPQSDIVLVRTDDHSAVLPVHVLQQDYLEVPGDLPVALPDSFRNPALALEPATHTDRYVVSPSSSGSLTVSLLADQDVQLTVTDRATGSSVVPTGRRFSCLGQAMDLGLPVLRLEQQRVALMLRATDTLDLLVEGSVRDTAVRYELRIERGYRAEFPADSAEENDFCERAVALSTATDTTLALTFDNLPDLDWFSLDVDGLRQVTLQAETVDQLFVPDVFVFKPLDSLPRVARTAGAFPGLRDPLEVILGPGDYRILVANVGDLQPAATDYTLQLASAPVYVTRIDILQDSVILVTASHDGSDAAQISQLTAAALGSSGDTVRGVPMYWSSSNPAVTVDERGVVSSQGFSGATAWITATLPSDPSIADSTLVYLVQHRSFLDVWGVSASDVWASSDLQSFLHFDGLSWSTLSHLAGTIRDIWGDGTSGVWAVGSTPAERARIFGLDGSRWIDYSPDVVAALNGVWGSGSSSIWAVADFGVDRVLHFDGTKWSRVEDQPTDYLYGIWGSGPSDVWMVGGRVGSASSPVVHHYDGTGSTNVTPEGGRGWLRDVWGSSVNDVWTVGDNRMVFQWDGSQWQDRSPSWSDVFTLRAVWVTAPTDVWIVGDGGFIGHHDGTGWSRIQLEFADDERYDSPTLNGVWGSGPTDVWVVGEQSTIWHFDGASWKRHRWVD